MSRIAISPLRSEYIPANGNRDTIRIAGIGHIVRNLLDVLTRIAHGYTVTGGLKHRQVIIWSSDGRRLGS